MFLAALAGTLLQAGGYTDPHGRFALQVPAGWTIAPLNGDAVQFAAGDCYLTVMLFDRAEPAVLMPAIVRQTGTQWRHFAEAGHGGQDLGGRPGQALTFEGINPRGQEARLRLIGASGGRWTALVMITAPKAEWPGRAAGLEQMCSSFRFLVQVPAPSVATRPPANSPG